MKNNISKLALLTGLLMINTNTKGFYQCVPKQDWVYKAIREYKCPAGEYPSGILTCVKCNPGTYSTEGSDSCTLCPAGKYASGYGSSGCTSCPAGQYISGTGSSSCTSCSPGTYASGTGNTSCSSCSAGSYASGYGNIGCSSCSPGSYQPYTGQTSCYSCSSNNCETSGYGATSCYSMCGGSTPYCNGSGSCVECRSGIDCINSNKGYRCSSGKCVFCDLKKCQCGFNYDMCECNNCSFDGNDDD